MHWDPISSGGVDHLVDRRILGKTVGKRWEIELCVYSGIFHFCDFYSAAADETSELPAAVPRLADDGAHLLW